MSAPRIFYPDSDNTDSDSSSCSSSPTSHSPLFNFASPLLALSSSPASSVSSLSSMSSPSPSASLLKTPPRTPSKAKSTKLKAEPKKSPSRRVRSPDHIPRPRNAFMIYRSEFYQREMMTPDVERDHRIISRVIGMCWKKLSVEDKKPWYDKAAEEKRLHQQKYPGYRFRPQYGGEPKQKRNVKRNGPKELQRCAALADAILKDDGSDRDRVKAQIKAIAQTFDAMPDDETTDAYTTAIFNSRPSNLATSPARNPFRSPLVAPSLLAPQPPVSGLQLTNMGPGAGRHSADISPLPMYSTQEIAAHPLGVQQPVASRSATAWDVPLSSSAPAYTSSLHNAPYGAPTYGCADGVSSGGWPAPAPAPAYPYATVPEPMPSISNYSVSLGTPQAAFHWATTTESLDQMSPSRPVSAQIQDVDAALLSQW